jgi:hypothetical protein
LKANYWKEMARIRKSQSERNIANWEYLFNHNCIMKKKIKRNVYVNNKIMKSNLEKSKKMIAGILSAKVNQAIEIKNEAVQGNWNRMISGEVKKCFSVVKLKVTLENIWSGVTDGVNRKVVDFVRDKLEKEEAEMHKRKVKRLRQKWKAMMKKNMIKETVKDSRKAEMKMVWTKSWVDLESRLRNHGELMLQRIREYSTKMMEKRRNLSEMLINKAQKLKK